MLKLWVELCGIWSRFPWFIDLYQVADANEERFEEHLCQSDANTTSLDAYQGV
ncbi:hypothetical protein FLK61_24520 [Paenalkalicoccus suaedae]|uniref:Uncharacterized protein n=1 Tax=Paenalkalicoccus suaedae TaxID=2592382 RepID=A0A859FAY8_9BACI|nr:hypothetical protein [Paenalkalicoccus suaedae]QKS69948.1 hypothetical protein FLK61_24520 [Paenalkalicoccus suaedae]